MVRRPLGSRVMLATFSLPLSLFLRPQLQPEVGGQSVRQVEPKELRAANKPHDARPRDARRTFEGQVWNPALGDSSPEQVGNRCRLVGAFHTCGLSHHDRPTSIFVERGPPHKGGPRYWSLMGRGSPMTPVASENDPKLGVIMTPRVSVSSPPSGGG